MSLSQSPPRAIVGYIVLATLSAFFIIVVALLARMHAELWVVVVAGAGGWLVMIRALLTPAPRQQVNYPASPMPPKVEHDQEEENHAPSKP